MWKNRTYKENDIEGDYIVIGFVLARLKEKHKMNL